MNAAAMALVAAYRAGIDWEDSDDLLLRAGKLTAALLLARVEGKSPAPYLTEPEHKRIVRDQARVLIRAPEPVDALVANWKRTLPGLRVSPPSPAVSFGPRAPGPQARPTACSHTAHSAPPATHPALPDAPPTR